MKRNKIAPPDVLESHRGASDILAKSGTRLLLIEAIVLLILAAIVPTVILDTAEVLGYATILAGQAWVKSVIYRLAYPLMSLFGIFVYLPLCIGFLRLAHEIVQTGEGHLTTLFSSFSCARLYRRALRLSCGFFAWVLAAVLVCMLPVLLLPRNTVGILLSILIATALALLMLIPMLRAFPTLALALDARLSMREIRQRMRQMRARMPVSGRQFFLSWVPQILLGILTFGILLIWDTLPRMAISYFLHQQRINETIIRSEEHKQHE